MEIRAQTDAGITVLTPSGPIDATTSAGFQARLLEALGGGAGGRVVVDLAGVDFMSSAGLRAVMVGAKQARAGGGRFAVAALTATVREIFEISKFHLVVPVFPTVAEAIASVAAPGSGPGA